MRIDYKRWSEHPYPGEQVPPRGYPEPGYWPMFFISRRGSNDFLDPFQQRIHFKIKNPYTIDWEKELVIVKQTLASLTPQQRRIAQYWGTGELTEKITAIIISSAQNNRMGSPHVARVLGCFHAAVNDVCVITWHLKYLFNVARPTQYDRNLPAVLITPRFPAYPSAHATIAGCAEIILSYFFPAESFPIRNLVEETAQSRLYAGVHFKVDNDEGLRLGRQIGEIVVNLLQIQNVSTFR
ncbi:vanadium-dependent haloperoxidase [Bacillus taeanensis]|uniref:Phosphatidic acid phosphatase type 2/haloperoxidase domain-containing protein n=1 Tax=Bacillus taeanensis TaxID=273032 RepID=A0A366XQA4_9BACI|nr:vanadium-dependent haloperoxidase [Bacillus taeanensis]RBW68292.1 hypothetical protein DS031_17370 [Bacillus taeanensis]